jgi:hypothetical protein
MLRVEDPATGDSLGAVSSCNPTAQLEDLAVVRYQSKKDLLADITREYDALTNLLDGIPPQRHLEPGVWGNDWNVHDLVAHLFEWHQLFLGWFDAGKRGLVPAIPAAGFAYREIPRLNREIQRRYADEDPGEMRRQLDRSHHRVCALAEGLTQEQILEAGHFAWTKKNALVTYLGANTSSHYRFAIKVLKRWLRGGRSRSNLQHSGR